MAHASPLADTINRCERCNALFLVSRVMLNSGTWSIIFCVYISPRYRVKSKNFLWVFWLLQLQMRPWHREKRSFPSFVDKLPHQFPVFSSLLDTSFPRTVCTLKVLTSFPMGRFTHTHTHTLWHNRRENFMADSTASALYFIKEKFTMFSTMRAVTLLRGRKMQKLTKQSHVKFLFSHSQSYFGQKTNGGQKRTKNASQLKWLIGPSSGVKWRKHYVAKTSLAAPISSELH